MFSVVLIPKYQQKNLHYQNAPDLVFSNIKVLGTFKKN